MSSKTRLANKTIWGLEDIRGHCRDARRAWETAMERAKRHMDAPMMAALAMLSHSLAEIEQLATDARHGEYNGAPKG